MTLPEIIRWYYECLPENSAGGKLHIVLEDSNWDDDSIAFCQQESLYSRDTLGLLICDLLLQLPMEQREALKW